MKRYGITDITLGLCRDLGREGHAVRDAEVEIGFSALALAMVPRPVRTRQTDFLFSAARAPMTSLEKKKSKKRGLQAVAKRPVRGGSGGGGPGVEGSADQGVVGPGIPRTSGNHQWHSSQWRRSK